MTTLLATVGFTPSRVLRAIDTQDEKEELVLFYDKDREGRSHRAAREVAERARSLDMRVSAVGVDAFDLVETCVRLRGEIRARAGCEIVVAIAGGTRVLGAAALLAGILEGTRLVHVNERTNEVHALPLLQLSVGDVLSPEARRVLLAIRALQRERGCLAREVAAALRITKGTVSHHVGNLQAMSLVEVVRDSSDRRSVRLSCAKSADLLLAE